MAEQSKDHVPFGERDSSEIAAALADAFDTFVFSEKPAASKETKWAKLSDEARAVISAEMLNEPQECKIVKAGTASLVHATCQVETGGGYGVYEVCIAYQRYKDADWEVLWYLKEETD